MHQVLLGVGVEGVGQGKAVVGLAREGAGWVMVWGDLVMVVAALGKEMAGLGKEEGALAVLEMVASVQAEHLGAAAIASGGCFHLPRPGAALLRRLQQSPLSAAAEAAAEAARLSVTAQAAAAALAAAVATEVLQQLMPPPWQLPLLRAGLGSTPEAPWWCVWGWCQLRRRSCHLPPRTAAVAVCSLVPALARIPTRCWCCS